MQSSRLQYHKVGSSMQSCRADAPHDSDPGIQAMLGISDTSANFLTTAVLLMNMKKKQQLHQLRDRACLDPAQKQTYVVPQARCMLPLLQACAWHCLSTMHRMKLQCGSHFDCPLPKQQHSCPLKKELRSRQLALLSKKAKSSRLASPNPVLTRYASQQCKKACFILTVQSCDRSM